VFLKKKSPVIGKSSYPKKRLYQYEHKMNALEEKIVQIGNGSNKGLKSHREKEPSEDTELNCKICSNSFDIKKNLKLHMLESHPQSIKCNFCDKMFAKYCDLEIHIQTNHETIGKYQCDVLDKKFILKWRLKNASTKS
jgi:hypothetical protein